MKARPECINIRICPTIHVLINDNLRVSENCGTKMLGYCAVFLRIVLKWTSTEAHVYMRRHQGEKCRYFGVSDVIYHEFSHGAASFTLNGENVNVMLELGNILAHLSRRLRGSL